MIQTALVSAGKNPSGGGKNQKKNWDADKRRFSGFYQTKNVFGNSSTQICVSLNKK
jgi:hypothetical protein